MSVENKSKRVIVLGATGSLGTHVAVHMKKCGYDVIAVGHSRPDHGFYAERDIEYMTFDIADKSAFERLPQENVWAVLNFAGVLPAIMEGFNGDLYISSVLCMPCKADEGQSALCTGGEAVPRWCHEPDGQCPGTGIFVPCL